MNFRSGFSTTLRVSLNFRPFSALLGTHLWKDYYNRLSSRYTNSWRNSPRRKLKFQRTPTCQAALTGWPLLQFWHDLTSVCPLLSTLMLLGKVLVQPCTRYKMANHKSSHMVAERKFSSSASFHHEFLAFKWVIIKKFCPYFIQTQVSCRDWYNYCQAFCHRAPLALQYDII